MTFEEQHPTTLLSHTDLPGQRLLVSDLSIILWLSSTSLTFNEEGSVR
jgi:hypothetical protein